jgi:indolepyruvate ferredoxin oxidoreductase
MGNETGVGAALEAGPRDVDRDYRLEDNRSRLQGRIFLTGTQALVRMLLLQRALDERDGLATGGFVSGYRGSPLAGVDMEMWRAKKELDAARIRFLPAVNEDLAATAVMGTQQVQGDPERTVDGVFAMWYGKGPGVDRAGDAIRHGHAAGSSAKGGVLMVVGDDHAATSSSIPNASDLSLMGWGIPIVHPASVDEYVEFGLWGWAASRHSGAWVAFKAVSETVESGRSMDVQPLPRFRYPGGEQPSGVHGYRADDFLTPAIEQRLAAKLASFADFARLNSIDRLVVPAPHARIGIVAVGKAYHDVMDVLGACGLDLAGLERAGVRIYKPGLVFPIDRDRMAHFARGLDHVLVVEEKASVVEQQLKDLVFNWPQRPSVAGKCDLEGQELVTWVGQLRPALLAAPVARWMERVAPQLPRPEPACFQRAALPSNASDGMRRLPYFCSGCPHNTSTKVPEGSKALAGVGCHYMASWMDRSTSGLTQMGGEGADWVGHAPFTSRGHVFQNMGEGTYFHSGFLAIRQSIAARVNVTYKILFNDAVAMTGGQPVDGTMSVPQICREMQAEGARRVVVVTDQPGLYDGVDLAGVPVRHRRELDAVQRELREIEGVTVLVYDQTCAAEKRRRRKKNRPGHVAFPDPPRRLFINAAVCEGCGDCGVQSNCLSIAPLETEFGRKRRIDQSSCNKDYSCAEGFCPSFVSVIGGAVKQAAGTQREPALVDTLLHSLPQPTLPSLAQPYDMLVAGVGGTGVITIGQVVAMAAHLEGRGTSVLDFTALAQKGGSVVSHLRIAREPSQLHAVRLEWQRARLLMACDLVVATLPDVLATVKHGTTRVLANTFVQTLAEFTRNPDIDDRAGAMLEKLRLASAETNVVALDARAAAQASVGDAMASNMFMLGHAWQSGLVPVSLAALDRALELNGVSVEQNRRAFAAGRLAAHDAAWLARLTQPKEQVVALQMPQSLDKLVAQRRADLVKYQDERYARRYESLVQRVRARERELMGDARRQPLAEAVARSLYKLMAIKDEYEVARLHADPAFEQALREQFDGDFSLRFHMAPPLLARRDAQGHMVKKEFGPWMLPVLRRLAGLKRLRGTLLDVFGYTAERRMERSLLREYESLLEALLPKLSPATIARAAELARLPETVRGFGHVKERNVKAYRDKLAVLREQLGI